MMTRNLALVALAGVLLSVPHCHAQTKHMRVRGRGDRRPKESSGDSGANLLSPSEATTVELENTCAMERLFCKVPSQQCAVEQPSKPACVKKLFVTGAAGSGTHFVAHYLSKVTGKGTVVKHESPSTSPDVLVSWPSRCPDAVGKARTKDLNFKALGFGDASLLKNPMVLWANKQLNGRCAYAAVVHLVRHPLKFLSSNFAFGQCLECWALVERLSVPPIHAQTADARRAIADNRRA